ncbi:Alpha/Beta hydrolase protein [Lasiosphaeria miniovina]|uniref:Carboxylic ester hydrolase n=1 Tax=Lasiosphaeria miniovina TaxID=1954250 RepID=A0AA40AKI5_9PEZI|nr:Alpha/Beta hydrolase protein [Lasiosphaeria miniovina]KAK0717527.1 Alpha/Beta hydrolase protein [Lasiosphaeria miniovina]
MSALTRITCRLAALLAVVGSGLGTPSSPDLASIGPALTAAAEAGDVAATFVSELVQNVAEATGHPGAPSKRALTCSPPDSLVVDVGYAKYQGSYNASTGLNSWRGVRFADAPVGGLRWQPPRFPAVQEDPPLVQATSFGPVCPQSLPSVPSAAFMPGNEDCLFLNVYAPANAQDLPVMVWIHGGGYGLGDGTQAMAEFINANNKRFVVVSIQYRLGAFGFLASKEVKDKGAVNAGILDQALALSWVKLFACQFGGDASSVTIAGESAGAGSVMYHGLAVGGALGSVLFDKSIAASPYLPFQHQHDDASPTSRYYALSVAAGCPASGDVFACLVGSDTAVLQQANFNVTQQAPYGYWAFYPVTDNVYITGRPTEQLAAKRVNGDKLLVSNNANEGPMFVPQTIATQDDLVAWLRLEFPNMSEGQISLILAANPNSAATDPSGPRFETDGLDTAGANAVNVSQAANGQQQRANNIYGEATFVCPAYWMASAYTTATQSAWLYQYSVPLATHGADVAGYFGPQNANLAPGFQLAFRTIWGNFVVGGNPAISDVVANGGASAANPAAANGASAWPAWSDANPKLLNINETGGTPYTFKTTWGANVTQFANPGLRNAFALAPADTWEGGRGARCAVYQALAPSIPA